MFIMWYWKPSTLVEGGFTETYMKATGFRHPQGSGYISKAPMHRHEVFAIIDAIKMAHPFFGKCIRDIAMTDVGKDFSLNDRLDYDGTSGELENRYLHNAKALQPDKDLKARELSH